MENNFRITIKSARGNDAGEYINLGTVSEEYGDKVIKYTNYEGDFVYDTKVVIGNEIVSVINTGKVESVLNFEKGTTSSSVIKTEYGNIPLEIKSNNIVKDLKENSLYLLIEYEAFYSDTPELFRIEIKAERII
jgi:uncharacterized beta-barrel protein YwiB (DUF1934 family)